MLTRRRARLERWIVEEKPQEEEIAQINALSDLALELVFSFLDVEHIVVASQVCTRWRDICSSRRLWTSRRVPYGYPIKAESLRVVRLLRRQHGVPPYCKIMVARGNSPLALFLENGDKLVIFTPSSLMVLLCLRHLIKDNVFSLDLCVGNLLTDFEALVVWETIASKPHLVALNIIMRSCSALLRTNYKWLRRGSLCAFSMSFGDVSDDSDDSDSDSDDGHLEEAVALPVRSLLQVHRHQLLRLDVEPESQQPLLDVRPRSLRVLTAVVLPSLVNVVKPLKYLSSLFLISKRSAPRQQSYEVLSKILSMRKIRRTLELLDISLALDVSTPHSEALLSLLSDFERLESVALRGVCRALSDPDRGPEALKTLWSGLRSVRRLTVEEEPSMFPLHALLPRTVDGGTVDPLVRVPAQLSHLVLGNVKASWQLCDAKWLQQLRRVMDAAPKLHVLLQGKCLEVPQRRGPTSIYVLRHGGMEHRQEPARIEMGRPEYIAIYPHPCSHTCQDCQNFAEQKKGCVKMYIGDLCEPKQG
ncbi:uncharacterized protein LOC117639907 [Thrips palmi]|uniref:Uncharacterized protein LOC117639907 n=1 Tax=Thrips palmi TaxID=161013 RepID=A0A6P8Y716_THRPL|nr:uncharacterized protein LOC117639907 [Thrips palmi]XP_034231813.1 uncharacterized protein LOC117639907 [Thrips palmi]XP_034231814.1 uncharacterized protein LOC117639907 [Thrips palmi]XP_034231815.1 uncharacterized protein LOC117639907 [Thrips palmi]XP_034231816.1 uncharacterized protein LOC117639907 [Thrips palmi]XP_034231817.1 uncharacterized protein LOC117639907 [Thrips palmi]XP_034231818.1 uncharacterized protein LOC117639907 [Thrips palmi]XP_034231819.1 uncharacterized protein LOC1176